MGPSTDRVPCRCSLSPTLDTDAAKRKNRRRRDCQTPRCTTASQQLSNIKRNFGFIFCESLWPIASHWTRPQIRVAAAIACFFPVFLSSWILLRLLPSHPSQCPQRPQRPLSSPRSTRSAPSPTWTSTAIEQAAVVPRPPQVVNLSISLGLEKKCSSIACTITRSARRPQPLARTILSAPPPRTSPACPTSPSTQTRRLRPPQGGKPVPAVLLHLLLGITIPTTC